MQDLDPKQLEIIPNKNIIMDCNEPLTPDHMKAKDAIANILK